MKRHPILWVIALWFDAWATLTGSVYLAESHRRATEARY